MRTSVAAGIAAVVVGACSAGTALGASGNSARTPPAGKVALVQPGHLLDYVVNVYDAVNMGDSTQHTPYNELTLTAHSYGASTMPCPPDVQDRYVGLASTERWDRAGRYVKLCYPGDYGPTEFTPTSELTVGNSAEARAFNWQPALDHDGQIAAIGAGLRSTQYGQAKEIEIYARNSKSQIAHVFYSRGHAHSVRQLKKLTLTLAAGKESVSATWF